MKERARTKTYVVIRRWKVLDEDALLPFFEKLKKGEGQSPNSQCYYESNTEKGAFCSSGSIKRFLYPVQLSSQTSLEAKGNRKFRSADINSPDSRSH